MAVCVLTDESLSRPSLDQQPRIPQLPVTTEIDGKHAYTLPEGVDEDFLLKPVVGFARSDTY